MLQISGCVLFGPCEPFVTEGGAEMVSTFDLFGERVPFNQVQCEGENNFHLSRRGEVRAAEQPDLWTKKSLTVFFVFFVITAVVHVSERSWWVFIGPLTETY